MDGEQNTEGAAEDRIMTKKVKPKPKRKRVLSAEGIARIAAAQRKRWREYRKQKTTKQTKGKGNS